MDSDAVRQIRQCFAEILIICGDFNTRRTLWDCMKDDTRSQGVSDSLSHIDMITLNDGSSEFVRLWGSDHRPIFLTPPRRMPKSNRRRQVVHRDEFRGIIGKADAKGDIFVVRAASLACSTKT